jgi:hypothetical protein
MVRLGIKLCETEADINRQVLERLGVPVDSIRVLAGWAQNTQEKSS